MIAPATPDLLKMVRNLKFTGGLTTFKILHTADHSTSQGMQHTTDHLQFTTYHTPLTTYHLLLTTYYSLCTTYHLPLTTYKLPLTTYHFGSFIVYHLTFDFCPYLEKDLMTWAIISLMPSMHSCRNLNSLIP